MAGLPARRASPRACLYMTTCGVRATGASEGAARGAWRRSAAARAAEKTRGCLRLAGAAHCLCSFLSTGNAVADSLFVCAFAAVSHCRAPSLWAASMDRRTVRVCCMVVVTERTCNPSPFLWPVPPYLFALGVGASTATRSTQEHLRVAVEKRGGRRFCLLTSLNNSKVRRDLEYWHHFPALLLTAGRALPSGSSAGGCNRLDLCRCGMFFIANGMFSSLLLCRGCRRNDVVRRAAGC